MCKFDEIRSKAEEAKQKYLEDFFQPLVEESFMELCKWLPKRKITLNWGMGTYCLQVERKSKYSYTSIFDNYGSINDAETMRINMKDSFLETPLFKLVHLLDNCHCTNGYYLCLKYMQSENILK